MASNGNFCVMNPANWPTMTFSHGNLRISTTTNYKTVFGTTAIPSTGKWYFEVLMVDYANGGSWIGVSNNNLLQHSDQTIADGVFSGTYDGTTQSQGSAITGYGSQGNNFASDGDVFSYAIDMDNQKFYVARNNTYYNSGNPSTGSNGGDISAIFTNAVTTFHPAIIRGNSYNEIYHFNFGADSTFSGEKTAGGNADSEGFGDFFYAVPTSYKSLCSANLPISDDIDPAQTSDDFPQKQFGVVTYTGNSSTNAISNLNFRPDLVWVKSRNQARNSYMADSSRGTNKILSSTLAEVERTETNLTSFDTNGFTLSSNYNYRQNWNESGYTYVAWCWRCAGGTTSSNSDGALTSTVQVNQSAGFSISLYTSNGSGQTFGHGLGATPDWFIIKKRDNQDRNWISWHKDVSTTTTGYFRFNTSNGEENDTIWNNTAPTSSVISVQKDTTEVNSPSGDSYICYAWRGIEGYSKFGKFIGNGSDEGPFIYLGFRPKLVAIKWLTGVNSAEDWGVFDTARSTSNPSSNDSTSQLQWNTAGAGSNTSSHKIDFLSNGFKLRGNGGLNNTSGATYIYMCWADVPFKYNNTF